MPHCDRGSSVGQSRAIKRPLTRITTHSFPLTKALFCFAKLLKIHFSSFSQRGGQAVRSRSAPPNPSKNQSANRPGVVPAVVSRAGSLEDGRWPIARHTTPAANRALPRQYFLPDGPRTTFQVSAISLWIA